MQIVFYMMKRLLPVTQGRYRRGNRLFGMKRYPYLHRAMGFLAIYDVRRNALPIGDFEEK